MADRDDERNDDLGREPEEEFREMLRELLAGGGGLDASRLAGAAGLPNDPASLAAIFAQLQQAMNQAGDGIDWSIALRQGEQAAAAEQRQLTDEERARYDQAFQVASLWLDEAVDVSSLPSGPELMTRRSWVAATMPVWGQLAEPVALSISDSLTRVMSEQAPEEMRSMIQGASRMLRGVGGTLFAMQLGQVVGQLATEVVSGGDIGLPLIEDGRAAILPQNVAEFGTDLEIPADQVELYLAVRELAHARLFRHARWLRLHVMTSITTFAKGIDIDLDRLERLADGFDPSNTDELRDAVVNGELIRPRSEPQQAALDRLETMLALIEGWVDVATEQATLRLPKAAQIAETIRRRRASGGPAESALATLVGLELRPRRLRDAAAMWRAVTDAVGVEGRDALWAHPDIVPTSADLDDPAALVARLTGDGPTDSAADEEFDQALQQLLRGETPATPGDATPGDAAPGDASPGDASLGDGDPEGDAPTNG